MKKIILKNKNLKSPVFPPKIKKIKICIYVSLFSLNSSLTQPVLLLGVDY